MGREWKCEDCGTEFTATATQLADEHGECPECGSCAIYAQP
jgi:DNA-directed RNA polymerase subunit RPC12/RpoP